MRLLILLPLASACGRYGFNSDHDGGHSKDGHLPFVDADYRDAPGTVGIDAALPPDDGPASCANFSLGSTLGAVASGSTSGHPDTYKTCGGAGSPDVSYAWTAPSAGQYTIDVCNGPDQSFDSALTVYDGGCTGTRLACDDDGCGTFLSRTRVTLTSGQLVVIVVDGYGEMGKYVLTITKD
ncbi:MAG: hypothetical protein ABI591_20985 [Kofleriaceae bacterium]